MPLRRRASPSRERLAPKCASSSRAPTIRSRTGTRRRARYFAATFLYSTPRRWLRMAYCTSCLDGPADPRSVVLQWGGEEGAPFVISGQAWGESNLIGRPAILDTPVGRGHVVAFNFNPLYRDLNRGDHRMVWNAIINWQTILADRSAAAAGPSG